MAPRLERESLALTVHAHDPIFVESIIWVGLRTPDVLPFNTVPLMFLSWRYRLGFLCLALLLGLGRSTLHRHGHLGRDSHQLVAAEQVDPTAAQLQIGVSALEADHYEAAIAAFTKAIESDPKNEAGYLGRAGAYRRSGQYAKALADANEAVRLNPDNSEAYVVRGVIHLSQHDSTKAIADFSEAIRRDSKCIDGYLGRGDAYLDKDDFDRAIADHTIAIQMDPENSDGYSARGEDYEARKDYDRAIADYNEAIQKNDKDLRAYNGLAWISATCPRAELRDGKQALEYALYVCKLDDYKHGAYLDTLAAAYAEAGQFDEAVRWETKSLDDQADLVPDEVARAQHRLELYKRQQPYRDDTPSGPAKAGQQHKKR